jgi:hypothetical protein
MTDNKVMSRERFFGDVRRAWDYVRKPVRVEYVGSRPGDSLSQGDLRLDVWLSPANVSRYAPEDFRGLDEERRSELDTAVREFRAFAETLPADAAVTTDQYLRARELFDEVSRVAREIILDEWKPAATQLVNDAEAWSSDKGWESGRETRRLRESLLGEYELPSLAVRAKGHRILLEPEARFVPAAFGLAELSEFPSFQSLKLFRDASGWQVKMPPQESPLSWSEPVYLQAVEWLARQA